MTDRQKREIIRLRRLGKSHKQIAVIVGITDRAAQYWIKQAGIPSFHATRPPDPYSVTPEMSAAQYQAACASLREVIAGARAERATAPIFRIRPEEWA
jgi:hypothetical protein